jgi:ubiquinone/menaquinone biosynthesis C-methylase UbiE
MSTGNADVLPGRENRDLTVDENGYYQPKDMWMDICGIYDLYQFCINLLGDVKGKRLLDCGCGSGNTAIMFAKRGAEVAGFDTDEGELAIAKELAKANGVDIDFRATSFESTGHEDASFDIAFGAFIIHHVDIEKAMQEANRILKPGGRAVFIENSARNSLLMFARRNIVGSYGVPKYGDDEEEHPLTLEDLDTARRHFPGEMKVHHTDFLFFRLVDLYVFQKRSKLMTRLLSGLDKLSMTLWPGVKRYSYFQVLQFDKPLVPPAESGAN